MAASARAEANHGDGRRLAAEQQSPGVEAPNPTAALIRLDDVAVL
jgi:hypothetical protein